MNNERAIEIIRDYETNGCGICHQGDEHEIIEAFNMATESLEDDWIDVRDRLPEENGLYIVTVHNLKEDDIFVDDLNYDVNLGWDYFREFRIIAWRPLSEPYKREE